MGRLRDEVADPWGVLVAADGNGRHRGPLVDGGVNGNDAFDAASEKQLGIRAHEFVVMVVGDGEEEEIVFTEEGFNPIDDGSAIEIADFLGDDADGVAALDAERTGEEIRAIVELAGSFDDAGASALGNGARGGRIVENTGNSSRREVEMQSERFESNGRRLRGAARLSNFFHGVKPRSRPAERSTRYSSAIRRQGHAFPLQLTFI